MRTHSTRIVGLVFACLVVLAGGCAGPPRAGYPRDEAFIRQDAIFVSGQDGYHTYRIPSLIVSARGTALAFCEGRKNSSSDTGDIDVVLKRSDDGGRTWGPMRVIADDGPNTFGNPCPVVDRATGTIWLLLTHNLGQDAERRIIQRTSTGTRTVWLSRSTDDGRTWSKPAEITAQVKRPEWTWYATGPGCGIQTASGRLVIPCDHVVAGEPPRSRSHVIYSDDHGTTWRIGGVLGEGLNECQVVERADGALMLNMRNNAREPDARNRRAVALSRDGGQTWSAVRYDAALVEPVCQASLVRFTVHPPFDRNRLLFANPANAKRVNLMVRVSYDEGETWPAGRSLHPGPAAYSALATLPDVTIGCLYERGERTPYETITFARFSLEWLTSGTDSP